MDRKFFLFIKFYQIFFTFVYGGISQRIYLCGNEIFLILKDSRGQKFRFSQKALKFCFKFNFMAFTKKFLKDKNIT